MGEHETMVGGMFVNLDIIVIIVVLLVVYFTDIIHLARSRSVILWILHVEANPQQENNFVFLSPFHSIFVIYTPSMLSERVSVSSCSEKETMCLVTR